MAKKKKAPAPAGKLAGKTVAFVGKFGHGNHERDAMQAIVASEGGSVVEVEKVAPDYLVAGAGVGGNPPAAVAKVQKKHPQVQVIDHAGFYQLVIPTAEEFLEILRAGPHGHPFWSDMQNRLSRGGTVLDLSGTDFRNREIEGTFYKVCLDNCDFRGAKISAYFDKVKGATFDGATLSGGSFTNAEGCSLKRVTMNDTRWNPAVFVRCDFTGARLGIRTGSHTTATECVFKKADLTRADLGNSKFRDANFQGATLTDAMLETCDFTGANLAGADLSRADLRNAILVNADLSKAKVKDAILSGADLTGATIDGADFTGANVTGTNLTGLDLSKAKNLDVRAKRTAGPNMLELARVANASKQLKTSIELDLGKGETVILAPTLSRFGIYVHPVARYTHLRPDHSRGNSIDVSSFEQGMLELADLWSRGTPRFDTVEVEGTQCPLRGQELQDLAVRAWYEACGLEVPATDELQKAAEQSAADADNLRQAMIAELGGGSRGVAKWNARTLKEQSKLGKLRKHDFRNAKLAGVRLKNQDLEGCTFDGATAKKAVFCQSQLKGASFTKADLSNSYLDGCKCSEASFEGATLTKCNLRAANFRRCNFREANLTAADLAYSDVSGADFSGATLAGVEFFRTRFDEKTILPAGFVPPEGMDWKGVGPRPGTPAPSATPPKTGTLDFDAFLEQLNHKVELARMQKAGAMLKAERFQLFAEVKDDSLVGVVKSQSSKDLVYSCRLASDGTFGCCTQNLRPCGGLRGALCKHLLVLIVGLARADQLDLATLDYWIDLSKSQKPAIHEDAMSATFLRYKGAEAGELDWRPTETIPEDFYAM